MQNKDQTIQKYRGEVIEKHIDVCGLRKCSNTNYGAYMNRDYIVALNIRQNLLSKIYNGNWSDAFTKTDRDQKLQTTRPF